VDSLGAYSFRGNRHGPPGGRRLSSFLSQRLTAWQTLVITLLWLYVFRNFGKLVGLECPEPLANLYTRSFFRATWVTTALDAGFWSAMHVKRKSARNLLSMVCSCYYLIFAEQADEKVRKVRSVLTVDHLRVSWNKSTTPILAFITRLQRPRLMRYQPRAIRIPRPADSSYSEPVHGWLYFDGPVSALKRHTKVILNIPGGGFVAMSPRTHDDALFAWAGKTRLPVLSLDYRKAPEFPYPYALNECYDVYHTLIASRGRCIGLSGDIIPKVVVSGDSAGGNLAAGLVLMIIEAGSTNQRRWQGEEDLPIPAGLVLLYPALDMNIGNWMTDEQLSLIRDRRARKTNRPVLQRKNSEYSKLTPSTPHPSDDEDDDPSPPSSRITTSRTPPAPSPSLHTITTTTPATHLKTRLATPSLISYVSDRVLTPEMMRAMILLYIGPHNRPDFTTEHLLSPVLAPSSLLALFPRTYFLTGERDPLVDDTVIMAGRIRRAKHDVWTSRREMHLPFLPGETGTSFRDDDHVTVKLVEGISHGFTQFASLFPEAWGYIFLVGRWYEEAFAGAEVAAADHTNNTNNTNNYSYNNRHVSQAEDPRRRHHHHHRRPRTNTGTSSNGEDARPLEMSSSSRGRASKARNPAPPSPFMEMDLAATRPHRRQLAAHDADAADDANNEPHEGLARGHPLTTALRRSSGSRRSMVSVASEDDLLARRMRGLVGSLTRKGGGS